MSNYNELQFNERCCRLQQNDPTLTIFQWDNLSDSHRHDRAGVPFDDTHCMDFGRMLSGNTYLEQLVFRLDPAFSSDITARGSEALIDGFRKSKLNEICFEGNIRDGQQLRAIFDVVIRYSSTIRKLKTCGTGFDFVALSTILHSSNYTTIQPCSIVELCFSVRLSEHDIAQLARALYNNYSIKSLKFDRIPMSDNSIAAFVQFWRHDSPLTNLRLGGSSISPHGAQMLLRATAEHPFLQTLDLSCNHTIGHDGLSRIGQELGNTRLVELDISSCAYISQSTTTSKSLACRALAEGLQMNQTIQNLSWSGNYFGHEGLQTILRATTKRKVQLNTSIKLKSYRELKTVGEELGNARLGRLRLAWDLHYKLDKTEREAAYLALSKGLNENKTLRAVGFTNFWFANRDAEMVLTAVYHHPTIEELNLTIVDELGTFGNQFATSTLKIINLRFVETSLVNNGIGTLAQGLSNNVCIQELCLLYTRSVRFNDVLQSVTNHPSLRKVSFDMGGRIPSISEIKLIAEVVLPSLKLKEFHIKTRSSTRNYDTKSILGKLAQRALLEGIKNNFYLYEFDFPDLGLNDHINFYLDLNRCGRLHLMDNALAPGLWTPVLEKLASKAGLMYYFLREQPWLASSGRNRSS